MCNTEQRGITGSNDRCQSKEVDVNQSPAPLSRSVGTPRSPEWRSSLVGLDSLGKLRGADPRSPRHSIYHHPLSYPRAIVSLSQLRFMNGHTKSGGHWNAVSRVVASASGGLGTPQSHLDPAMGWRRVLCSSSGTAPRQRGATRPIGWPPDGNRKHTGRAASVPHFSFNRKSLLLPFGGVCSRLYSREIHLEMSSE